jgi:hypothetical protein
MAREFGYNPSCLPSGAHVSVLLPTGAIFYGRCRGAWPDAIVIQPWGTGECRRFPVTPGVIANVIEPCSWEETVAITRRQRAGLPAAVDANHASKLVSQAARQQAREQAQQQAKRDRAHARMAARSKRDEGDRHDNHEA